MSQRLEVISQITGRRAVVNVDDQGQMSIPLTLAAAIVATTWTKTDANTGTAVLPAGHGLISTDVVAVFWAGGSRYGLVATLTGDSAALDGGAGDDLPASDTPVWVAKKVDVSYAEAGNDMVYLEISGRLADGATPARALVVFLDGAVAPIKAFDVAQLCVWWLGSGLANPLAGAAIASLAVYNGDVAANNVRLVLESDVTP